MISLLQKSSTKQAAYAISTNLLCTARSSTHPSLSDTPLPTICSAVMPVTGAIESSTVSVSVFDVGLPLLTSPVAPVL